MAVLSVMVAVVVGEGGVMSHHRLAGTRKGACCSDDTSSEFVPKQGSIELDDSFCFPLKPSQT